MSPTEGMTFQEEVDAKIHGQRLSDLPADLYIPPDALRVFLEMFEGPLDLLLYLIRKHDLDILEISITAITDQYLAYIEMMSALKLQLAGDYLVMAATLAEMKSRLMLPKRHHADEDEEEDPRAELRRRLLEYERIKEAATDLDRLPRVARDIFPARVHVETQEVELPPPQVSLGELLFAFSEVWQRVELYKPHDVNVEAMTVPQQMRSVLDVLKQTKEFVGLEQLFDPASGKRGIVYTFLALLELLRSNVIDVVQTSSEASIYVKLVEEG